MSHKKVASNDKRDANGFTSPWILGLAMLVLLTGAIFAEFGSALVTRQQFVTAADRASNAGATALDEDLLISSDDAQVNLDPVDSVQRCNDVIRQESSKVNSKIKPYPDSQCFLDVATATITARVVGEADLGIVAGWTGVPTRTFTVTSNARPSCSDTSSSTGAC